MTGPWAGGGTARGQLYFNADNCLSMAAREVPSRSLYRSLVVVCISFTIRVLANRRERRSHEISPAAFLVAALPFWNPSLASSIWASTALLSHPLAIQFPLYTNGPWIPDHATPVATSYSAGNFSFSAALLIS